jgi:hypothetical protein
MPPCQLSPPPKQIRCPARTGRAALTKVFLGLFFRKERRKKDSSFSEEKEAKRLLFWRCFGLMV